MLNTVQIYGNIFIENILYILFFPSTPIVIIITILLIKTRRYYLKIKWFRIIPSIILFFCGLYFLLMIFTIYSNTKNNIRAFTFQSEIKKIKPSPLCQANTYVDKELGFSLQLPYGICNPRKNYLKKYMYIAWGYRDTNNHVISSNADLWRQYGETPLQISIGKFYNENILISGKELIFEIASQKAFKKVKKSIKNKIATFEFNGLKTYRLELLKNEVLNNRSLNIVTFQYGDLTYIFETTSSEFMNSILKSFHFTDNKPLITLPSPPPPKTKNELKLFFPPQEKTIANNDPTFMGKIRQEKELYLETKYGLEKVPFNQEENGLYLSFLSGKLKNIEFFLDNKNIRDVYGIPQYPTVSCYLSYEKLGGGFIEEPLVTKEECIKYKSLDLPPVIFFFKTDSQLAPGQHKLMFKTTSGFTQTINFFIQPNMDLPWQNITINKNNNFEAGDNCMTGYYYEKNYLHIPIPNNPNPNLFYVLSFPQSESEKGSILRRKIQIKFEDKKYDILIPNSSIFYFADEITNYSYDSWNALFLPIDKLYYTDGVKAYPWIIKKDGGYANEYFEIFPMDLKNRFYRGKSLPWETTNSSGCDG